MNRLSIFFGIATLLLMSCYTELKKPDWNLMNTIKKQASLDSSLKTTIVITPKKYYFGSVKCCGIFSGSFYIKNTGNRNFHIVSIKSNCDCIKTKYTGSDIYPHDSLKVTYEMKTNNVSGLFRNAIIAIGNCQYGNQTYYFEGTIN